MRYSFFKPVLILSVTLLCSFTFFQIGKNELLLDMLMSALNQAHYNPLKINDEFSEKAFNLYLKRIDTNKKFLLQSDIDEMSKYRREIDDEVNNGSFEFYNLSAEIIAKRIKEKENWTKEILANPLNYQENDEYESDGDKTKYANSEAELKGEWKKMLKYSI